MYIFCTDSSYMSYITVSLTSVARQILEGLKAPQKYISSKFFYDSEGSRIFQEIMEMPEYYLTNSEAEIFETHKTDIISMFCKGCGTVDLVELGAGDGLKTRILISELFHRDVKFRYIPVDISEEAVVQLAGAMKQQYPELELLPRIGDYFHMIGDLSKAFPNRKVVMFLGSNLGNFDHGQSIGFLSQLNRAMSEEDLFFVGLDLKKEPEVIRKAYDDPHGHTSRFNLNLLSRMNRELGADFDPSNFVHSPRYDPETGTARSFLESTCDQEVYFPAWDETIPFTKSETIFTEMSQKYDPEMIAELAILSGFQVVANFFDHQHYFVNSLWKKA